MPDAQVSFAGNLTDQPEVRHTDGGIARATFRVAVSGRRDGEASFFTVVVWRDQAEHAAESLSKGSRVVIVAGSSSGPGPPRTAAPARWSRSLPRSWDRACGGRPPRRSRPPGVPASSDHGATSSTWTIQRGGTLEGKKSRCPAPPLLAVEWL
jgi:hypothetical protein